MRRLRSGLDRSPGDGRCQAPAAQACSLWITLPRCACQTYAPRVTNPEYEHRLSAVEQDLAYLKSRQTIYVNDADVARQMAAATDRDVADFRQVMTGHTRVLNALRETQVEHGRRLDGIDGRLDGVDGKLDGIDGRLDEVDGKLDGVDRRLAGIDGKLVQIVDLLTHRG